MSSIVYHTLYEKKMQKFINDMKAKGISENEVYESIRCSPYIDLYLLKKINIIRKKRCRKCPLWCLCGNYTMSPIEDDLGDFGDVDDLFNQM
jgi:hypothetical protein